jgi:hypothetical protein
MSANDQIVDEVRTAREAYVRRFNFDLAKIYEDLKAKEQEHNHDLADLEPVIPRPNEAVSK